MILANRAAIVAAAAVLATAIAIPSEGIRFSPYYDPPGILTVCRGHTGADVIKNKRYSLAECDKFMSSDMHKAIAIVERCVPGLPVEVLAAFSDAVFNMGGEIVCDTTHSTAARLLKSGNLRGACEQLRYWNKARIVGVLVSLPGLTKRREKERELCLKGVVL
jgi:lysozyme